MIIGYARTSTADQVAGFEAQKRELQANGCEKVFSEQVSSVAARAQLDAAMDFVREGDVFVVTKLDRLARSMRDLLDIVSKLDAKSVTLRILAMNLDTSTSTGRLMLNVLGSVAQFEREVMLERQREGIAKAKSEGLYRGRKSTTASCADQIRSMAENGNNPTKIARELNLSRQAVYRALEV